MTSIEEIAKRDYSLWVIQQHLIGEYGKKGEKGLKRENLLPLPIKKGKAHWDFRFQRIDANGKALETLESWEQDREEVEYFFMDPLGRLRFVPESEEEKSEYSNRVTLSRKHSRNFKEEFREEIESHLRKWKSRDLRRVDIFDAPDKQFNQVFGIDEKSMQGGGWYERYDRMIKVNGYSPLGSEVRREIIGITTLEHELSHAIFYEEILHFTEKDKEGQRTGKPYDYEKDPKYKEWDEAWKKTGDDIKWVSSYGKANMKEGFAESLAFMNNRPATTAYLKKKCPETLGPWFDKISNETGYKLRKVKPK